MKLTLQWVDSSNGQLDGLSKDQTGEHGRKAGREQRRELSIQRIAPTFHLPSGQLELLGITSASFNPCSVLWLQRAKTQKEVHLCVCVCVFVIQG